MSLRHIAGAIAPPAGPYDADIVILALDRAEETIAAIHSALDQTALSFHLIVVDQGSAEATLDRFSIAIAGRRNATLLAADRNYGVAGGRNRATAFGHGGAIVALDNDAEFASPTTAAELVAVLEADAALAAVACRIVLHATGEDDLSSWGYPRAMRERSAETFDTTTFVGAGHAIRRRAWTDVGGYDERLFFCWEEYDFCVRAIAQGWTVCYRGDIVVRHKVGLEQRVAWSGARWFHFVRNRLCIGRKHGESWLGLSPRSLAYILEGLRHGRLRETIRAIVAAAHLARTGGQILLPDRAKAYLRLNDANRRGSWLAQFLQVVGSDRLRRPPVTQTPDYARPGHKAAPHA